MTGQAITGQYTYQEIMSQPEAWRETLSYLEAQRREA